MFTQSKYCQVYCLLFGMLPVAAIALHILHWVDLANFYGVVLLLYGFIGVIAYLDPKQRKLIFLGWLSGVIAVSFYDVARIPFMWMGWEDFIPKIGGWLIGENEHFLLGYLWRYIGNGGGLGITFFMVINLFKKSDGILVKSIIYGLFICACLDVVLLYSKDGEQMMFAISKLSLIGGTTGHIVYGLMLGIMMNYFRKAGML